MTIATLHNTYRKSTSHPNKEHRLSLKLFSIVSLLLALLCVNSANAGRYYQANSSYSGAVAGYGSVAQSAADDFVVKFNVSYNRASIIGSDIRYSHGGISLGDTYYGGFWTMHVWNHFVWRYPPKEFDISVQISLRNKTCPPELTENGTGSCVTPAANPKQGNSCSVAGSPNPVFKNPIIVATGNKFQTEVDYQSQHPFGLSFIRYYNSTAYNVTTDIGIKWRHNGNNRLAVNTAAETLMYRNNGQVFSFNFDGTHWLGDVDISDTLVELVDTGNNRTGWSYTTANDHVEVYNLSGQLISITNRQGQAKIFSYDVTSAGGGDNDNSTLDKVTAFNNEAMTFTYDSNQYVKRITSITTPEGHTYQYSYDTMGNLQMVTYPDNTTRIYHYEDTSFPHHLSGITDETGVRYATWQYDSQGRAISSEHAGGVDKGTLVYNADGSVTTTDTLGKQTTYHFTTLHGVKKVTQVEGHASDNCAAANKNYSYDANGYLQSKTDWQGKTTTYIHNARGLETSRTHAFGTTEARTITTDWHTDFRLPIKITEPSKVTDYSYDAQGRLTSQTSHTP